MIEQDIEKMGCISLTQPQPYTHVGHWLDMHLMHIYVAMFDREHRNKLIEIKHNEYVGLQCSLVLHGLQRKERATSNKNVVQTDRKRYPWQHHHFGFASSRSCCAKSTTQHANPLGDHPSPDLAVHLIHFNLRFDVSKRLHPVFMLSMPSWEFLGLY